MGNGRLTSQWQMVMEVVAELVYIAAWDINYVGPESRCRHYCGVIPYAILVIKVN
jgi:hypothetical protein